MTMHSPLKLTIYKKVKNVHNVNTKLFKKHFLYILAVLFKFSNIYLPIIIGKKGALPLFFSSSEIIDSSAKQIRWPYFKRRMLSSLFQLSFVINWYEKPGSRYIPH